MAKQTNYWAELWPERQLHIYNHGVGRDNLFLEADNYRYFLSLWRKYLGDFVDTYAYCLMPNHFHFVVRIKHLDKMVLAAITRQDTRKARAFLREEIPVKTFYESQFRRLFMSYSKAYGKRYQRQGSLFRAKFKRIHLISSGKFWNTFYYVHHNPIHHGFRNRYDDWPYSSYSAYTNLASASWIAREVILTSFDPYPARAQEKLLLAHEKYRSNHRLQTSDVRKTFEI